MAAYSWPRHLVAKGADGRPVFTGKSFIIKGHDGALVAGRIVELGTHDELIARNGYYADLFQKQLLEEELAVTH